MRGEQLTRQWRILRTIETRKNGATVAELAEQEDCHPRTIWQDLSAIQNPQLFLLFQFNPIHDSQHQRKAQLSRIDLQCETHSMTMGVGGLVEVMSWVIAWRPYPSYQPVVSLWVERLSAMRCALACPSQKGGSTRACLFCP